MSRMLNEEETKKLDEMPLFDCNSCPIRSSCKKVPEGLDKDEYDYYRDEGHKHSEVMSERVKFGCDAVSKYPWEVVYGYMRDSKYGRSAVNWEHG